LYIESSYHGVIVVREWFIVIDNMEVRVSRWVLEEYVEAYRVARSRGVKLYVSGLVTHELEALLARRGVEVIWDSRSLCNRPDSILLDLWAEKTLDPLEVWGARCFIVGGIMGDHPPRGRTRLLYDKYPYAARRNIGPLQFSVDGTVKMLVKILGGMRVDEIEIAYPVTIEVKGPLGVVEVELPYAYPVEGGRPMVPEGIVRLLERGIMWDELHEGYL
jgi:ribosome biogenesis SPOUT family RNA methylase Rps3